MSLTRLAGRRPFRNGTGFATGPESQRSSIRNGTNLTTRPNSQPGRIHNGTKSTTAPALRPRTGGTWSPLVTDSLVPTVIRPLVKHSDSVPPPRGRDQILSACTCFHHALRHHRNARSLSNRDSYTRTAANGVLATLTHNRRAIRNDQQLTMAGNSQ